MHGEIYGEDTASGQRPHLWVCSHVAGGGPLCPDGRQGRQSETELEGGLSEDRLGPAYHLCFHVSPRVLQVLVGTLFTSAFHSSLEQDPLLENL